jgi:1,2-diacylglycerol 3-alpha-glucosyltransferase
MKLLVCTTEYYPQGAGIANVAYNVVKVLQHNGVNCSVCSPDGPDIKLGSQYLIQKMGIIGLLYYWYRVSRYYKKNNYDVVWLHNPFIIIPNPFTNALVTMHSTYHGESKWNVGNSFSLRFYKNIVASLERYCLSRMKSSTVFSGVGQLVCDELGEIGIDKDRIICIPNGVDTQKFHPSGNKNIVRELWGIPKEDIVLLSVGRLTPAKQPFLLLELFSALEKKLEKITLCIAGDGELFDSTQKLAKRMGVHRIKFLGHVDNQKELPGLIACADYHIMTSKYEGGKPPLTLSEAMASGLPCIVSDIPQLEIVRDADCGIVVRLDNIQQSSYEILDYLKKDNSSQGRNARAYAVRYLDWRDISNQYYIKFRQIANHD